MPSTALSELLPKIVWQLPSCPEPIIIDKLREVIREWCEETRGWNFNIAKDSDAGNIKAQSGVQEYDLVYPSYGSIITIEQVTWNDRTLTPVTDYTFPDKDTIRLVHAPTADDSDDDDGIEVALKLTLKDGATHIDQDLYRTHWQTWVFGVIGYLRDVEGTKWYAARTAAMNMRKYWEKIAGEKWEQYKAHMTRDMKALPTSPFAIQPNMGSGNSQSPYHF